MTPSATLSFKNQFFASFYEAAELCKASEDGGLLILLELLNDKAELLLLKLIHLFAREVLLVKKLET